MTAPLGEHKPITAKFSEEFYAKLGHRVTGELVDWFNKVDTTYRTEFRELFGVHFSQLDAKLEQRLAEFNARFEVRLAELDAKLEKRLAEFDTKPETRTAELAARLERRFGEQARWLFAAWASLLIPIIGLWIRG